MMSLNQKAFLSSGVSIAGLLVVTAAVWAGLGTAVWTAGLALLIGGLALHFRWHRCPCCGGYLGKSSSIPRFCPNCGKPIDPDAKT